MGLAARLFEKRHRVAPFVVAAAVVVIGSRLSGTVPRDVDVRYELGPDHHALTEARIGYRRDGEEIQTVRFGYRDGAPSAFDHRVTLAPGEYEVVADVRGERGTRRIARSFEVPADGIVRLRLFESSDVEGAAP
jgi:hypothetical protein